MRDSLQKIPLTPKMLLITAFLGLIIWGIQDLISTRNIKTISDARLREMLGSQAQEDRIRFDNYVEMYHRLSTIAIGQKSFTDYVLRKKWIAADKASGPTYFEEPPEWLSNSIAMHRFVRIHYALLLDGAGVVKEIYKTIPEALPASLMQPANRIIQMSHDQSLLLTLDGSPILIASESVLDAQMNRHATLMLVARLNDDFLIASQGLTTGNKLFGLAAGSPARLIACSRPDLLPAGVLMDLLQENYVVFKKSFFDMGSSELAVQFVSFMARSEFDKMNAFILQRERAQRAILSLLFILTSAIIMFWITKQIKKLAQHIAVVSRNTLDMSPSLARQGDELRILAEQFDDFTKEIIMSRERLKKQAEELLREKTVYLDNLLHSSDLAIIAIDLDLIIKYYNPVAEIIYGHNAREAIGVSALALGIDKTLTPGCFTEAMARTGLEKPEIYPAVVQDNGKIRYLESRLTDILDNENHRIGLMLITQDITQRRQAEEALASEKERLAVTLRSIGDGVITTDTAGRVILLNKVAEQMTGWSQTDAAGRLICDIFRVIQKKNPTHCLNPVQKVLEDGNIVELADQTILIAKDGTERLIADSSAPIHNNLGAIIGAVLVFRDITEKTKILEERANAQRLESIGVLAGGIAHDFNNMLHAILGYTHLIKEELGDSNPVLSYVEVIERSARRSADLTKQLLGFARSGKYQVKAVGLNEVVTNVVQIVSRTIDKAIEIVPVLTDNLWKIEADQSQLEHVLMNLCINARDAMPDGGTLSIETSNFNGKPPHPTAEPGQYVVLQVKDSGTGIKKEIQQRIFEPFFTTKEVGKGTGMGLAMAYGVIKNHKGFILVDSEPGQGSSFTIYFPATASGITDVGSVKEKMPLSRGKGTILVVDDEDIVRLFSKEALSLLGYTVLEAANGIEAVEIFTDKKDEIIIVLLDVMMPKMGGKETFDAMKSIKPDVKVLLASGYAISHSTQEILDAGAQGFIQKPFDLNMLALQIKKAMERPS